MSGGLMSGGRMSGGRMSGGRLSGGLMSGGLMSAHRVCQTCLQVACSRVESNLESLNAQVRVESRIAGREVKSQVKSII